MEEYEERFLMELFNASEDEIKTAIGKVGTDIRKIRRYVNKVRRREIYPPCRCKICGRLLTNPESIVRGYGSECYGKINHDADGPLSIEVMEDAIKKDG